MLVRVGGRTYTAAEYPITSEPSILEKKHDGREILRITVFCSYQDAARDFVDGASIALMDEAGNEYDKGAFAVAGDIVDHRDGRITVYMAKPSAAELEKARASMLEKAYMEAQEKLETLKREAQKDPALRYALGRSGIDL